MNISSVAKTSGVSAKMIRHYELIGLIPTVRRTQSGYRTYCQHHVDNLRLIRAALNLGFHTHDIGILVALKADRSVHGAVGRCHAEQYLAKLEEKARDMAQLKNALHILIEHCVSNLTVESGIQGDKKHHPQGAARPACCSAGSHAELGPNLPTFMAFLRMWPDLP
ncbi:MerR family DNA-binding transcriptional regulator [Pseudoduganella violacea]|uniref:DNA-binding transcriptional MerR regulator n=1 Tax=Pseudoduganella violacea TaxID=1715466 RepID=A0A7W5BF54_9BURK|nr:MerR family DNA-binding transcriptional regulator [Pseudoduganella violacea]MBB3121750.1 DNA-binding transcriptional MerR regulator [Pseudoduganella violacea]